MWGEEGRREGGRKGEGGGKGGRWGGRKRVPSAAQRTSSCSSGSLCLSEALVSSPCSSQHSPELTHPGHHPLPLEAQVPA